MLLYSGSDVRCVFARCCACACVVCSCVVWANLNPGRDAVVFRHGFADGCVVAR